MGFSSAIAKAAVSVAEKLTSTKAVIVIDGSSAEQIPVQFNPSEYRIVDRSNFSQKERRNNNEPVVNYSGSPLSSLSVKLYFDSDEPVSVGSVADAAKNLISGKSKEEQDITKTINKITALTRIDGDNHKPPGCVFVWGSLMFSGYAESVSVSYTMFDNKGKPLRAVVDLTMRGFNDPPEQRKSPFMSPDRTKARIMTEDNSIWNIAENEYGDVREWRRIADANNIDDPLSIPIGKVLKVPSIND